MDIDDEAVDPARVGMADPEMEAAEGQLFAGFRKMADGSGDVAGNGVIFIVRKIGAELLVEFGNRGQRVHEELAVGLGRDHDRLIGIIVLVIGSFIYFGLKVEGETKLRYLADDKVALVTPREVDVVGAVDVANHYVDNSGWRSLAQYYLG